MPSRVTIVPTVIYDNNSHIDIVAFTDAAPDQAREFGRLRFASSDQSDVYRGRWSLGLPGKRPTHGTQKGARDDH